MPIISQPFGIHPYDIVIGASTREPPLKTIHQLILSFPEDFRAASSELSPDEWRLLYEIYHYPIYALTDPGFDPYREVAAILDDNETMESTRAERIQSEQPLEEISDSIRIKLATVEPDLAKAIWCILCRAKQEDFDEDHLIASAWWQID